MATRPGKSQPKLGDNRSSSASRRLHETGSKSATVHDLLSERKCTPGKDTISGDGVLDSTEKEEVIANCRTKWQILMFLPYGVGVTQGNPTNKVTVEVNQKNLIPDQREIP